VGWVSAEYGVVNVVFMAADDTEPFIYESSQVVCSGEIPQRGLCPSVLHRNAHPPLLSLKMGMCGDNVCT
jgi:hypothetical protein